MIPERCDRRLSRAARELLRRHLFETWSETLALSSDSKFDVDVSEWNVWQFLEATLVVPADVHLANDLSCPLVPSLDIYMHQEAFSFELDGSLSRSIQSAAIPGVLHSARKGKRPNRAVFHQCGACQKNFTSHFYLDKHLEDKHPTNNSNPVSRGFVCPAITYCDFLSQIACFDQAMLLEPFYGPGSDGYGTDHRAVQHKLLQRQPVCSEQSQRAASIACHKIVDVCFEGIFGQILSTNMCSRIPECQSRLFQRLIGSSLMILPDQWQDGLAYSYKGRAFTWIAFALSFLFLVFLYAFWLWGAICSRPGANRSTRRSLLNNKVASKWSLSSPTTFIGPPLKMKNN